MSGFFLSLKPSKFVGECLFQLHSCASGYGVSGPLGTMISNNTTVLNTFFFVKIIQKWVFPKIMGYPKMDGENHGKRY